MSWRQTLRGLRDLYSKFISRFTPGAKHLKLGKLGEEMASNALSAEGYRITDRNLKVDKREIDIVAIDGGALVFIEVKTRSGHSHGKPAEAIDKNRRARMRKAGELYAMYKRLKGVSIRFDVVTVDFADDPKGKVEIIKNAF
ncbi:hypothetical protein MNBD_NITROSPINAE04-2218 [hydrothermal vent metagenome]|uniref:Uncharacterized protein n=1 Tax=hydrothermal vent metagenome TaxID=652676 RepID=A0A3B1CQC3_9ZZZZ